jgi:CheY-like chemotaxis protein/anti-sigma regulatory factor (Ser/Thr protein kinase)
MTSPAIDEGRHVLNVDVPRGLIVDGDVARLAQVVANLLTNAAKYTDTGGRIDLTAAADGATAALRVADRGSGIAPEMLATVFDLFAQAPQDVDRSRGGLGLGLAIVRSLVGAHGGTVSAHSDGKGTGSTFTIRLPLIAAPLEKPAEGAPRTPQTAAVQGTRILVVDDNADAAELLAELLQALGHTTHMAFDGPGAVIAARQFLPEVVLLDLGLPVMDGFEVAGQLRSEPQFKDLAIVAVTGYGQELDRERTRNAGFDDHVVKPVDLDYLKQWLLIRKRPQP